MNLETIKKELLQLSEDYKVFGQEVNLPQTHTIISGRNSNYEWGNKELPEISIYFNNEYTVYQITINKIVYTDYSKTLTIPIAYTEEDIMNTIEMAKQYLFDHLLPNVANFKIETLKKKHKEIKELERKLKQLKYGK